MPQYTTLNTVDGYVGQQLHRPECALAHSSGLVVVPSWSGAGGVSLITPDDRTHSLLSSDTRILRPNGIALEPGGSFLLAHLGDTQGGIFRLHADGSTEPVVTHVNGEPMPPANYVVRDSSGRLWITVSTRKIPRASDYRAGANSGFIAVAQPGSGNATIVADGLGYTNECVIDEHNGFVYVNETFGRRLTRFTLSTGHGLRLGTPELVHAFGPGDFPDGLAMDVDGGLWISSIVSNRLLHIDADRTCRVVFEDSDAEHLQQVEAAYQEDRLGREHLDNARSKAMKNISSVAFGGTDGKRLYLGNLLGDRLPFLNVDIKGKPPVHWDVPLGALAHIAQGLYS